MDKGVGAPDFFAAINPNWSQQDMSEAMSIHIDQTVAYAAAVIGGEYSDATAKFDEAKAHMMDFADPLSQGIITQFPDKYGLITTAIPRQRPHPSGFRNRVGVTKPRISAQRRTPTARFVELTSHAPLITPPQTTVALRQGGHVRGAVGRESSTGWLVTVQQLRAEPAS